MNHEELKGLLRQAPVITERTCFCPEDQDLADYFGDTLETHAHERIQRHMADCGNCRARLGMLSRLEETDSAPVPEHLLASSKQMARPMRQARLQRAPLWVAAAVVVLATGLAIRLAPVSAPPGELKAAPDQEFRKTRNIDPPPGVASVLAPRMSFDMENSREILEWTSIPGSLHYQVRIVSDEGDLLWQERVTSTSWILPDGLRLDPGVEYFARVDAFLDDSRTLKSDFVGFRMGESR